MTQQSQQEQSCAGRTNVNGRRSLPAWPSYRQFLSLCTPAPERDGVVGGGGVGRRESQVLDAPSVSQLVARAHGTSVLDAQVKSWQGQLFRAGPFPRRSAQAGKLFDPLSSLVDIRRRRELSGRDSWTRGIFCADPA